MKHVLLTGACIFLSIYGRSQPVIKDTKGATIGGIILNVKAGDTLSLQVFASDNPDNVIFEGDGRTPGISRFETVLGDRGQFHFQLPRFSIHHLKMTLNLKAGYDEFAVIPMSPFNNEDSLMVRARADSPIFLLEVSGRGSTKYNAEFLITQAFYHFRDSIERRELKNTIFNPEEMDKIYHRCTRAALTQLNSFKSKLSNTRFQTLRLDLIGAAHAWWLDKLMEFYKKYSPNQQHAAHKLIELVVQHDTCVDPEMAVLSIGYLSHLYNLTADELRFQNPQFDSAGVQIKLKEIYNQIETSYRGQLRDNLIFQLLRNNIDMYLPIYDSTTVPYWRRAYNLFTIPELKKYAWKRMHFTQLGVDAYPFSLPDSNGRMVNLDQFKGKTVLIDVWFTGCQGCLAYAKWLKTEIYPVFDKDTNIVFISISGDINRNTWLASVRSARYTRPENVNLYTGGLGFTHPFLTYYDFDGGPYALLIDKNGKFYSANLPRYNADQFIPILRNAMK